MDQGPHGWSLESQMQNEERSRWADMQEQIRQDVVGHDWSSEARGKPVKGRISMWRLGWSLPQYERLEKVKRNDRFLAIALVPGQMLKSQHLPLRPPASLSVPSSAWVITPKPIALALLFTPLHPADQAHLAHRSAFCSKMSCFLASNTASF